MAGIAARPADSTGGYAAHSGGERFNRPVAGQSQPPRRRSSATTCRSPTTALRMHDQLIRNSPLVSRVSLWNGSAFRPTSWAEADRNKETSAVGRLK